MTSPSFSLSPLSRREALRVLSGAAVVFLGGRWAMAHTPVESSSEYPSFSILTPEATEGPYYIDLERMRRNITEGKPGVPLRLRIRVAHLTTGEPIPNAAVDVWHCDAQGVYSGFNSHMPPPGQGGPPPGSQPGQMLSDMADGDDFPPPDGPPPGGGPGHTHKPDNNLTFLRGVQITDHTGLAEIDTIFPGWYMGRTTHIHVRVHVGGGLAADGRYQGGHITHTGQLFFDEKITEQIYQLTDYVKDQKGRVFLQQDGIYRSQSSQPLAKLTPINPKNLGHGFYSDSLLVIDPDATPQRV